MKFLEKLKHSFHSSNRWKHFIACLIGSLLLGFGFALGAGIALEYKDYKHSKNFDVVDLMYSLLGGLLGALLKLWIGH